VQLVGSLSLSLSLRLLQTIHQMTYLEGVCVFFVLWETEKKKKKKRKEKKRKDFTLVLTGESVYFYKVLDNELVVHDLIFYNLEIVNVDVVDVKGYSDSKSLGRSCSRQRFECDQSRD
jgi:hypothetical protein